MRAVILGSDLMYDKSGRLVPIEINTNIGYDSLNRVESTDEWLDLTGLVKFVKEKGFKEVALDLSTSLFKQFPDFGLRVKEALEGVSKVYFWTDDEAEVEDREDLLFVRVQYSSEALVDLYCRDKVKFLEAISKSSSISQMFLYKEGEEVKGTMKDFVDNGEDPNYIVKYRYPQYDFGVYPQYCRLSSLKQVQEFAEKLEDDYLIMPCYLNEDNMQDGRFILYRQWSLVVPDEDQVLRSIDMGSYTKLSGKLDRSKNVWKDNVLVEGRENYNTRLWSGELKDVLLDAGDQVLMSDGTWKAIEDVHTGDEVLSLDVPHSEDVDIREHVGDYNVDEEEFEEDSDFTVNKVLSKSHAVGYQEMVHMTFEEDGEEWWDTEHSSYPVLDKEDGSVQFKEIKDLVEGDELFLVNVTSFEGKPVYVKRTVKALWKEREFIEGFSISLDGSHLFITKSPESTAGYVAIEHNPGLSCCLTRCRQVGTAYTVYYDDTTPPSASDLSQCRSSAPSQCDCSSVNCTAGTGKSATTYYCLCKNTDC